MKFSNTYLFFFCILLCPVVLHAQHKSGPVAKFSFNGSKDYDEISKRKAKLVGAEFTKDRFGNSNNAVYLAGNPDSYVNLGNYPALKSKIGTVSLWLMMEMETPLGKGGKINPVILTKWTDSEDYYEAYAIYYVLDANRIEAVSSRDSLKQAAIYSTQEFMPYKWHHLVLSYDHDFLNFYLDGKVVGHSFKNYETQFNPLDSVVLGTTASIKNARSFNGSVDDIEFYDRVLNENEIIALYHAPNPNRARIFLNWALIILLFVLIIVLIYFFIRYRLNLTMKKEKQRLELANQLLENELRINRALMNPHFMFNSLNTLHSYILANNVDKASDYLLKFSKLVRKVLDSNMSDIISLDLEIELIERYLEIEGLRFKEHIQYKVTIDPAIIPSTIIIPIMMLQPFIENSVWHGLRDKTGDKIINISFELIGTEYIQCIIDDNGTGRKNKNQNPTGKKSLATGFVEQRLILLNKIYDLKCSLTIIDKPNFQGTIIKIILPILKR